MDSGKWLIDLDRIIDRLREGASREAALFATRVLASLFLWYQLMEWLHHGLR